MRGLFFLLGVLSTAAVHAQKAPTVDLLQLTLGKPFPISPLSPAKEREGSLPFYSITVPMPETSALKIFVEYSADVMFDTKNIYALRASRTFDSVDACTRALKTLIAPLTRAYSLRATKSEASLFQAAAGDVEAHSYCGYDEGSPYPTLRLFIGSKAEKERVGALMKKSHGR